MKPESTIAVTKAMSKVEIDSARKELKPGTYEVDQTIRIQGTITVSEDTEKTPTVSIPFKDVLTLFVQRAGITRAASLNLLQQCVADALKGGNGTEGCLDEHLEGIYKQEIGNFLTGLPKTPVKGAVKAKLTVTEMPAQF